MCHAIKMVLIQLQLKMNFACFEIFDHEKENAQFILLTAIPIFIS